MITAKMTTAQFQALAERLHQEEGLSLSGAAGELQKNGVAAAYHFDGEKLTLEVTKHPFLVSKAFCEEKLAEALREAGMVVG